jgi:HAD superfamily hydrolase (TIGR01484 family)
MNRRDPFPTRTLTDRQFVLATDLDGTFLGGSAGVREDFYSWIDANRTRIGLIFVTGRDPEFITEMTRTTSVPRPDYVVGDVGTTIAEVSETHEISPIRALEDEIAESWGNAHSRVRETLAGAPGLTLQPTAFRYRMSFDLDPATFDKSAVERVEALGLDALISDNRFFDVLPKGISKGPSLKRLLAYLGLREDRTLVAGDTLNDLSMLALGLPAVAVGGSEPALVAELRGAPHVHLATGIGVSGIAEAITHHRLFTA